MRSHRPLLPLLVLVALASIGAWGGCDLFTPTTPESPTSTATVHTNFSDPESTLASMVNAFAAQASGISGTSAYMDALADPLRDGVRFGATFDSVAVPSGSMPAVWSNDQERLFFDNFTFAIIPAERDSMAWTTIDARPDSDYTVGDIKVLNRRYEVWNIPKKSSGNKPIRFALGYAQLNFVRVTRGWVVLIWEDGLIPPGDYDPPVTNNDRTFSFRRLERP